MDADDPIDWSVDRVIEEICHTNSPTWATGTDFRKVVNPEALATAFRENDIDGDTLLALEDDHIKADLNITSFGQRRRLHIMIKQLRTQSNKYQAKYPARASHGLDFKIPVTPQLSRTSMTSDFRSPSFVSAEYHPSIETATTDELSSSKTNDKHLESYPNINNSDQQQQGLELPEVSNGNQSPSILHGHDLPHSLQTTTNDPATHQSDSPTKRDRSILNTLESAISQELDAENVGTDQRISSRSLGTVTVPLPNQAKRKRSPRRVAVTTISTIPASHGGFVSDYVANHAFLDGELRATANGDAHDANELSNLQTGAVLTEPSAKRVKLAHVLASEQTSRSRPSAAVAVSNRHRRSHRRDYILITQSNIESQPSDTARPDETSFVFSFVKSTAPPIKDVLSAVKSIKRAPHFELDHIEGLHNQTENSEVGENDQPRPSTVAEWSQINPELDLSPELKRILKNNPASMSGAICTFDGESDDEDYEGESVTQSPPAETQISKSSLNKHEVDMIIDTAIEHFKNDWQTRFLPKTQAKAHKKWMFAAKNKAVHGGLLEDNIRLREKARVQIQQFRNGIHLNEWHRTWNVKQQCLAVEASVHQLEEYTYYVKVLECEQEPFKPPTQPVKRSQTYQAHTVLENGDEELDSDSGASFINDENIDETAALNQDSTGWAPKFTDSVRQSVSNTNIENAALTEDHEMVVDSVEPGHDLHTTNGIYSNKSTFIRDGASTTLIDDDRANLFPPLARPQSSQKQAAIKAAERNRLSLPQFSDSDDSDLDREPHLPRSKYQKFGQSVAKVIDLTMSSPQPRRSDSLGLGREIQTPELNTGDNDVPSELGGRAGRRRDSLDSDDSLQPFETPEPVKPSPKSTYKSGYLGRVIYNVLDVLDMEWDVVLSRARKDKDPRLLLAKCVYDLSIRNAKLLLDYVTSLRFIDDFEEIIQNGLEAAKNADDEIAHVEKKNQGNAKCLTEIFISYATLQHIQAEFDIPESSIDEAHVVLEGGVKNFRAQLEKLLHNLIDEYESERTAVVPSGDTTEEEILDDENIENTTSKSRKPKHRVMKRYEAGMKQEIARQQAHRKQEAIQFEQTRNAFLQDQLIQGMGEDQASIIINAKEPAVCLNSRVAKVVKPHQIQGIRFMWREIVENHKQQGCLLSHTMGLGKTMQVITLLATIAQCNSSGDVDMRNHIPEHLRDLRVLIVCPLALIDNWCEELARWLPESTMLGNVIKLDNRQRLPHLAIQEWVDDGGVLVLSYDRFQRYVNAPEGSGSHKLKQVLPTAVLEKQRQNLLEGANIVIADEAHRLKNAKSKLSAAAQQFKTMSRIALTGSPLNNHLEEYHTMIDWIAPGYLGDMTQFSTKYVRPIHLGLYATSSAFDRKIAYKKLHVLKRTLDSLIDRADITAISQDLPQKTEFFLTIVPTEEQKLAYKLYVEQILSSADKSSGKLTNTRLWDWLHMLTLLLNHPSCFVNKLQQPPKTSNIRGTTVNQGYYDKDDGYDSAISEQSGNNIDLAKQPALANAMQKVVDVFLEAKVLHRIEDPSLSSKTLLVKLILEEAVALGEKTIIFSKSIPTLDYYEAMVTEMKLGFKRIDGSDRYPKGVSRQTEVRDFNTMGDFNVFLISTKAGGLGLNIQSATRVIINDFDFNPVWEEQAVGRAYRIGQKKPVFVYRFLMGGTFDELIHNKAIFKTQLFTHVVDKKNVISYAQKKPGEYLFPPRDVAQCTFDDCIGKDPNVLDRVLEKVDCVRNIILTETFMQDDSVVLDEEELKAANKEVEMERLAIDNPEEYARRVEEQRRQDIANHRTNVGGPSTTMHLPRSAPLSAFGPPQQYSHYLDLSIPLPLDRQVQANTYSQHPSYSLPTSRLPSGSAFSDDFIFRGNMRDSAIDVDAAVQGHQSAPATRPASSGGIPGSSMFGQRFSPFVAPAMNRPSLNGNAPTSAVSHIQPQYFAPSINRLSLSGTTVTPPVGHMQPRYIGPANPSYNFVSNAGSGSHAVQNRAARESLVRDDGENEVARSISRVGSPVEAEKKTSAAKPECRPQ